MAKQLFFAVLLCSLGNTEILEEEDVLVLTEQNFQEALDLHTDLLIEFYSPNCGHCKKLAPEYAKAATLLKANVTPIRIGKVDATVHEQLAYEFAVEGLPTLFLIRSGVKSEYTGSRTADGISSWVLKRVSAPVEELRTLEELLKKRTELNAISVLFDSTESEEFRVFETVALGLDGRDFFRCSDKAAFQEFNVKEKTLLVLKQFDEELAEFSGEFTEEAVKSFIEGHRRPWILTLTDEEIEFLFENKHVLLALFRAATEKNEYEKSLKELSRALRPELFFSATDLNDPSNAPLASLLGVTAKDMPVLLLVETSPVVKYRMSQEINEDNVKHFIASWKDKTLHRYLRSQEPPTVTEVNGVHILVGSTYNATINGSTQDMLVQFYSPTDLKCQQFASYYEKLALELKSDFIFAKLDASNNEVLAVKVKKLPTFIFYPADGKEPIYFEGTRLGVQPLREFVKEHATMRRHPNADL